MRHDPILSQQACEMEGFPIADSFGHVQIAALDGHIQPELVSILETIN